MTALGWLIVGAVAFPATHLAMSHPLRASMVRALGNGGFMAVYSLVSLVTLGLAAHFYAPARADAVPWYAPGDALWAIASLVMWAGAILFAGSLFGNPALPQPNADSLAQRPATGVFAITRHPMMWGFALWALVHIAVNPTLPSLILSLSILVTALVGARGQDFKKRRLMGEAWTDWERRTAFVPFARGVAMPGLAALLGGTALFLLATYAHGWLGAMPSGLWRWL